MRIETIKENCDRLIQFRKIPVPREMEYGKASPAEMLKRYSLLLDVSGSPNRNLSILYFDDIEEFMEMALYAKTNCKNYYINDNSLYSIYASFEYDGYVFEIIKNHKIVGSEN